MTKVPMTPHGKERLEQELTHLKYVVRPEIVKAIAEARAHGDLRENAEYHAAKERQSFSEGRIREIEGKLSHAHVVDLSKVSNQGKVVFGAMVTLVNIDNDQETVYQIVGEDEADLKLGKISFISPIARAIIGKQEGDQVGVHTPNGVVTYEVAKVVY